MRFVWSVVAFILAAVLIGAGIAQRTVFLQPETTEAHLEVDEELPYTVVDSDVFRLHTGAQTLRVEGEGDLFSAYARNSDMTAWLSDTAYNHVTVDDSGEIAVEVVEPEEGEPAARNPSGSDLWIEEQTEQDAIKRNVQLPEDMSMMLAKDGTEPAPSDISLTWPQDNATPWAGPLIVAGGVMLLLGVLLYILGIRHLRRSRGPRRKSPPPSTGPVDALPPGEEKGVISSGKPRRQLGRGKRALTAVPVAGVAVALLAGCTPDIWPQAGGPSPSPSPTETAQVPSDQASPVLTEAQAERILADISETVAEADANLDGTLAEERLGEAALAARQTNYAIRGEVADHPQLATIPAEPIRILLPQAFDDWPRHALVVVEDEEDSSVPPAIMMLNQEDPWSNYKVTSIASLEASVEIPEVAPAWLGAALVPPDSSFLEMPPEQLADTYAEVLDHGTEAEGAGMFDLESDKFRTAVEEKRQTTLDTFNETGAETGQIEFEATPGDQESVSLATLESGAIVTVTVDERETVTPTNEDAIIRFPDPVTQTLTGEEESTAGVTTRYADQLFFYVPAQGSDAKIRLLGYSSSIVGAELVEPPE